MKQLSVSEEATGGSFVKINKHLNGWTWNVHVAATGNTLDELLEAKEKALQVSDELDHKYYPVPEPPF
jgi:hypothetical protein